ncbi:unnamed protein product (macronuclear) [Paramecium tetraurelia]|uniref:Uncharacterized protein n=1 Tax=Paramecium tetraurelia TaxID=5888 RepID=A0C394_PARTE|nr:uncharacterized protein GSPATT00034739001 [Paramecium tetraurelia]CAK65261.1 unnamed protein product [Paramecium tetraurelia]|eukprot:XP_001432658.1 hypothetical protein (macronuclear) [Paramecium tetraurelia strain d4-2]
MYWNLLSGYMIEKMCRLYKNRSQFAGNQAVNGVCNICTGYPSTCSACDANSNCTSCSLVILISYNTQNNTTVCSLCQDLYYVNALGQRAKCDSAGESNALRCHYDATVTGNIVFTQCKPQYFLDNNKYTQDQSSNTYAKLQVPADQTTINNQNCAECWPGFFANPEVAQQAQVINHLVLYVLMDTMLIQIKNANPVFSIVLHVVDLQLEMVQITKLVISREPIHAQLVLVDKSNHALVWFAKMQLTLPVVQMATMFQMVNVWPVNMDVVNILPQETYAQHVSSDTIYKTEVVFKTMEIAISLIGSMYSPQSKQIKSMVVRSWMVNLINLIIDSRLCLHVMCLSLNRFCLQNQPIRCYCLISGDLITIQQSIMVYAHHVLILLLVPKLHALLITSQPISITPNYVHPYQLDAVNQHTQLLYLPQLAKNVTIDLLFLDHKSAFQILIVKLKINH